MHCLILVVLACLFLSAQSLLWQRIGPASSPNPVNSGSIAALNSLVNEMKNRWQILDSQCDPNAVFALMYLYMTKGGLDTVQNQYYEDGDAMTNLILVFARRYSNAINSWMSGNRQVNGDLTQVWKDAFTYAASNYSSVAENMMQQMNVHINYDLGIAVYQANFSASHQRDYDRVNDLMASLATQISTALSQRYDPEGVGTGVCLLDDVAVDVIIGWRSNAWLNGQLLRSLLTDILREPIQLTLQTQTTVISLTQQSNNMGQGQTAPARIAHCQAHHAPLPF